MANHTWVPVAGEIAAESKAAMVDLADLSDLLQTAQHVPTC